MSIDRAPVGQSKTCGALGCMNRADVVIDHPRVGSRVVCKSHVSNHDVLEVIHE